jgi:hypothetical protein
MDKNELRSRRASIRKEIQERMQVRLDECKEEIKRQLKGEEISVSEKRERYRREAHEEKLRLMALAKQEFRARRKMLGHASGEQVSTGHDHPGEAFNGSDEPFSDLAGEEDFLEDGAGEEQGAQAADFDEEYDPGGAFILEETTEEREALKDFESPIEERDALFAHGERFGDETGVGKAHESESFEVENLFYYARNMMLHPVRALDEFDDYLITPPGLRNVAIFYLLSLVPFGVFFYVAQYAGVSIPGGMAGPAADSILPGQFAVIGEMLKVVAGLLIYSAAVASLSYLFTSEGNFVTLTAYFAFVEAVTGIIVYALIVAAILAAFLAPPLLLLVVVFLLVFVIWKFVLNIIVLMNTYGYGIISAFFLILGAGILLNLAIALFSSVVFGKSLMDTFFPSSF